MQKKFLLLILILYNCMPIMGEERKSTIYLPMSCHEIMPDLLPYVEFFENIALSLPPSQSKLSDRMLKLLALKLKLESEVPKSKDYDPIGHLIKQTFCYFREHSAPLSIIAFDDGSIIRYMSESIDSLEKKVHDCILDYLSDNSQKEMYEKKLKENQGKKNRLWEKAKVQAQKTFLGLKKQAKKTNN